MRKQKAAKDAAAPPTNHLDVEQIIKDIKKKQGFKGTQQNLYSYSRIGWGYYREQLQPFNLYSQSFTAATATDALSFIDATELMPSYEILRAEYVEARKELIVKLSVVLLGFQSLKDFIAKAYPKTSVDNMWTAAGLGYYEAAAGLSWDNAATLIRMGNLFMKDNTVRLTANNNMPESFPESFKIAGEEFTAQRQLFKDKEAYCSTKIFEKYEANEKIYNDLLSMTNSGKNIFKSNKIVLKNFIINNLYKSVRGNSPSNLNGFVKTGNSPAIPVEGALVYDKANPERNAVTDETGAYTLEIPMGNYDIVVEAEGFVPQQVQKKVTLGTKSRLSFSLALVPVAEPVQQPIAPTADSSKMLTDAMKGIENGVSGKIVNQ